MLHTQTARITAKTLFAVVGLALLGACADRTSGPTHQITAKAPAGFDILVGTTTFTWTPDEGVTKRIGDHLIVIPPGAICDLATSGYGPGTWDLPCDPSTEPVTITAQSLVDNEGHPYVDFQPALRFDPTKAVYLYLRDGLRDGTTMLDIQYCNSSLTCVDESATDTSLVTRRIGRTRTLYRRLKHFTGYLIGQGDYCEGTITQLEDGSLFCDSDGGHDSRSGYVVASGLGKTSTGDAFGRRRKADK